MTKKQIQVWAINQRSAYNKGILSNYKINLLKNCGFDFTNQRDKDFLPFEKAREFVRSLKLQSQDDWREYCHSGNMPDNIPYHPQRVYENDGWLSLQDFLGTKPGFDGVYLPFEKARTWVRNLKLKTYDQWIHYVKSGNLPYNIPNAPQCVYEKSGWNGIGDWLGNGYIATTNRQYCSFDKAKEFVQTLKLKTGKEWNKYCESGNLPDDIPLAPWHTYKNDGYISMGDWLGTGRIANYDIKFKSFEKSKEFARKMKFKSNKEWKDYCRKSKTKEYSSHPNRTYKKEWKGWGDFLGNGRVSPFDSIDEKFLKFEDARKIVRKLGLKNKREWDMLKEKPRGIPVVADDIYKNRGWIDWYDFLGITKNESKRIHIERLQKSRWKRTLLSFEKAREFSHSLHFNSQREWRNYCNSGFRPRNIPSTPQNVYRSNWISWYDWLGKLKIDNT